MHKTIIHRKEAWAAFLCFEMAYVFLIPPVVDKVWELLPSDAQGNVLGVSADMLIVLLYIWLLIRLARMPFGRVHLKRRSKSIAAIARADGYSVDTPDWPPFFRLELELVSKKYKRLPVAFGPLYGAILKNRGYATQRIEGIVKVSSKEWNYYEYKATQYSWLNLIIEYSSRYGMSRDLTIPKWYNYGAVAELSLPRKLPHLYFTSRVAPRRWAASPVSSAQRIRLEGNFNDYFTTYVPLHYAIDALALVTPDVMMALLEAKDYDIEIEGTSLYLYSDGIPANPRQYTEMIAVASSIYRKLSHNMGVYHDQRVAFDIGKQSVSRKGMTLRRNFLLGLWVHCIYSGIVAVGFSLLIVLILLLNIRGLQADDVLLFFGLILLNVICYPTFVKAIKALVKERRSLKNWRTSN